MLKEVCVCVHVQQWLISYRLFAFAVVSILEVLSTHVHVCTWIIRNRYKHAPSLSIPTQILGHSEKNRQSNTTQHKT